MTGPTWPKPPVPAPASPPPAGIFKGAAERGPRAAAAPMRLCLWSGPRNVSTALLYSFAQRSDTRVLDEPLYAHYLRVSGAEHPGRDEVLRVQESDGPKVVREVVLGPCDRPVLFQKHMAHHLVELDRSFLRQTVNVLLVRDPAEVVITLARQIARPTLRDTGLKVQCELLDELRALGQDPPLLDAKQLLLDPQRVLKELCRRVGLDWDPAMLSWPPGPRPYDGVWARHWYANVHRSTGFEKYRPKTAPIPEHLKPLVEECLPFYARLRALAIEGGDARNP
jgi:hypothetical protein